MNPYLVAAIAFSAVMVCVFTLTFLCLALRYLARRSATAAGPQTTATDAHHDEHLIVVLTAAASEALRTPVALYSIQLVPMPDAKDWTRAGRMDLMLSHRVERKR